MRIILPLVLLMTIGNMAYAERADYLPAAKLKATDASRLNLGAGLTQKLAHVNAECQTGCFY